MTVRIRQLELSAFLDRVNPAAHDFEAAVLGVAGDLSASHLGPLAELAGLLTGLAGAKEEGDTMLDRTMVLYGACMGSANAHSNVNLPVLLAGGGFKHGQHLAFDRKNNYPLANLYVSMLQRLGIEATSFATSKGTMRGLEMA